MVRTATRRRPVIRGARESSRRATQMLLRFWASGAWMSEREGFLQGANPSKDGDAKPSALGVSPRRSGCRERRFGRLLHVGVWASWERSQRPRGNHEGDVSKHASGVDACHPTKGRTTAGAAAGAGAADLSGRTRGQRVRANEHLHCRGTSRQADEHLGHRQYRSGFGHPVPLRVRDRLRHIPAADELPWRRPPANRAKSRSRA